MTRVTSAPRFIVLSFLGHRARLGASCGGSGSQAGKGPGLELDYVGTWQTPPDVPSAAARATAAERKAALRNPAAKAVAITGATVLTAAGRRYRARPGRPRARRDHLRRPGRRAAPSRRRDRSSTARGKTVTPGLIDAHSHLGVYPCPRSSRTTDGNEVTAPVTAQARAEYGFWPQDPGITRALAGGVTTALVLPGSANLIGGRGFTVAMRPGRTADEVALPGRAADG